MSDLVQRLRAEADCGLPSCAVVREAADHIEAYQRELAEWIKVGDWQKQRIDGLETALLEIVAIDAETDKENRWDFPSLLGRAQDIAKRILGIETLAEKIARGALEGQHEGSGDRLT